MTASPDRQIILELIVKAGHPALLEGLDVWLRLGLLTDTSVRQICQAHLTCPLPQVAATLPTARPSQPDWRPADGDFLPNEAIAPTPQPVGWLAQMTQSFMAEISVVWLLFLGVFMVVVSSAVLAATQWRNFPSTGQYSILLGYTLAFWGASVWSRQRPTLQLTARMLRLATLLLIPVNFWMMDGFQLWKSFAGVGMAAIAAIILTAINIHLLVPRLREVADFRLVLSAAIALSWLHWGWGIPGFPLVATYVGAIGAAAALVYQDGKEWDSGSRGEAVEAPSIAEAGQAGRSLGLVAIAMSTLVLLTRALLAARIPIEHLGLAAGICGWLLCWLARRGGARALWANGGVVLLLAGWLVTVMVTPPWQAIAVSGLGLWLLADGLKRRGQVPFLTAGFLVGLQLVWLLWRTVPPSLQQGLFAKATQLAGSVGMPWALIGVGAFPYLLLTVWLAAQLRHWQRPDLAQHAEFLALGLGIVLTGVSLPNPLLRSLNLLLSAITLALLTKRRTQPETALIYLTHGTGLAAIAATLYQCFPKLSLTTWAGILLVGMAIEWSVAAGLIRTPETRRRRDVFYPEPGDQPYRPYSSVSPPSSPSHSPTLPLPPHPSQIWQQTAWYFGLLLAGLSYVLLQHALGRADSPWGLLWLVTPLGLTILGYRRQFTLHRLSSWLSVGALWVIQPLLLGSNQRLLIGLGTATILMLLNTKKLKRWFAAAVTVGFGLGFAALAAWELLAGKMTVDWCVNLTAIALLTLWLLRGQLKHRKTRLARLYRLAIDGWAIALAVLNLLLLTVCNILVYANLDTAEHWQYALAAGLMVAATGYRLSQAPLISGFYLLAGSLELLVVSLLALHERSLDQVAIANLALGLGSQLLGDWWAARLPPRHTHLPTHSPLPLYRLSWHIIPLLYAVFGVLLQHRSFTAATGLYTLAGALVGIGVGRRQLWLKPLTYLSLFVFSLGAYELLLYQLAQVKGGSAGDGLVLLAGLGIGLAIALHLCSSWLIPYLRFSRSEVRTVAHLHYALGCFLQFLAYISDLSAMGWWIGMSAIAAIYALIMGNPRWMMGEQAGDRHDWGCEFWTYLGIVTAGWTLTEWLYQLLPDAAVLTPWAGAIAASAAVMLYWVPWQTWGWYQRPWQRSATVLPAAVTLLTAGAIAFQGLFIVAAFYAWLASTERQLRYSYVSLLLVDWAVLRLLYTNEITEPLWYAMLFSLSLLYVAQVDPILRSPTDRDRRHLLRSLATGLVCLTALYQTEVGIPGIASFFVGMLSIGLHLGFIWVGLWLRVRAFLFIGTAAFLLQVLRQLWLFIDSESLLLWAGGIALGLLFIWVAATFEARRAQITALVQYWVTALDTWE